MSCTTTALAGYEGSVTGVAGTAEITSWTISLTQDVLDATSFDSSGWRQFVAGLKGATGSMTAKGLDFDLGATASAVFTTKAGSKTFTASILINESTTSVPVDGIIEYSCSFTVCGEVT